MAEQEKPYVLDETEDFAVVYKPPRMHSIPLKNNCGDTLLEWYAALFPAVMDISGRRGEREGLLHRLDFETHGLVLFAKNQQSLDYLLTLQNEGNFIKEYSAMCRKNCTLPSSFPAPPSGFPLAEFSGQTEFAIESFFRPFGPGRKQVRPVTDACGKNRKITHNEVAKDRDGYYRTEIINVTENEYYTFTIRLKRGFRHQIRCHLAWIGCPVLNDPLYGDQPANGFLALRSNGLIFTDPRSGKLREYRIEPPG
ncbi:MAG: RNA pseudouridine synthase [Treponema sp.]|jgi:23S rRNA pseudouridine1911/1915/1917 synthase|nr:RNA pseudouridine synthase [Treponema sp.]